ncbi:hypothetical protein [Mesorhizobium sp.]|uniref:hypothetical protein n=1 Tax=Mesorhizobium sp. TaxID=1871066 RepID=UPI000FE4A822|nr:hypothetical protein [Mesorhizobium sp.]RWI35402.1 MAG: hypothetical protein EOR14_28270 [Mesorhizobium sp.]RWJ66429.1 MAG: hypothetical protein EOR34_28865 [Mesorhizobium sp.]
MTTQIYWHAGIAIRDPQLAATISSAPVPRPEPWQVWCNNELVGHLSVKLHTRHENIVFQLGTDDGKTVELQRVTHSASVSELDLETQGVVAEIRARRKHNIPDHVTQPIRDLQNRRYTWSWPALHVDLEGYELLFDDEDFEPA